MPLALCILCVLLLLWRDWFSDWPFVKGARGLEYFEVFSSVALFFHLMRDERKIDVVKTYKSILRESLVERLDALQVRNLLVTERDLKSLNIRV